MKREFLHNYFRPEILNDGITLPILSGLYELPVEYLNRVNEKVNYQDPIHGDDTLIWEYLRTGEIYDIFGQNLGYFELLSGLLWNDQGQQQVELFVAETDQYGVEIAAGIHENKIFSAASINGEEEIVTKSITDILNMNMPQ